MWRFLFYNSIGENYLLDENIRPSLDDDSVGPDERVLASPRNRLIMLTALDSGESSRELGGQTHDA